MLKLFIIVLISILSCSLSQDKESILKSVCASNLSADKARIVTECDENIYSKSTQDEFVSCLKQTMAISERTLSMICYFERPDSDKLKGCLKQKEDEAAAQGIVVDEKVKQELFSKYMECMAKAV